MDKQEQEGICVAIRMRGLNERELKSGSASIFKCLSNERVALLSEKDGNPIERDTYQYDKVFDSKANTVNIYDHVGRNLVEGVVTGINATIFAYGQTSSGKTYTMLGAPGSQGVLELAATDLFHHIGATSNRDFIVRVSFVEIYNEVIRDLLTDASDSTVNIREDPRKGVYCEASEHAIQDFDSVMSVLKKGISRRAVESTAMNDTSSRSHTIFKITVESIESQQEGVERDMSVLVASLNLVDLAGSESVRHTGATGQRAKEGGKINQSLLSLSRVIHALSQPGTHVSFRDSKLTRLLQPSLSGNAKMSIVCCVTPAEKYIEETRSTLQFASRAKLVKTNATVNEILDESEKIRRLTKELTALKEKQSMGGLSDGERSMLQADKVMMQDRLEALQSEKEEQRAQLQKLQELMFDSSLPSSEALEGQMGMKKKRKTKRDTWCPGAGMGPADSASLQPFAPLAGLGSRGGSSACALLPIMEGAPMTGRGSLDSQSSSSSADMHNAEPTSSDADHQQQQQQQQREEVERLRELVTSLQEELGSRQELIFSLQSERQEARPRADSSSEDLDLQQQLEDLTAANANLQNSLDEALVQVEELTYQRDDFEERLEMEMGANQESEQDVDRVKDEMASEIARLGELVESREAENEKLRSELDEANVTLHGQLEFSLMEEAAEMKAQVQALLADKAVLESSLETKSAKIVELISFLTAAKDSVGELEQDLATAAQEADGQKTALEAALSHSQQALQRVAQELGAWMVTCEQQTTLAESLGDQVVALGSEKQHLSESLAAAQEQTCELSQGAQQAEDLLQQLRGEVAALQGRAGEGDVEAQSEVARVQAAMAAQKEAHAEELDSVFKELEAAEELAEATALKQEEAEQQLEAVRAELEALREGERGQAAEKAEVQSVLYEQTQELRALQNKVQEMAAGLAEHDAVVERCSSLEARLQELEAGRGGLQSELDAAVCELDSLQQSLQSAEEELLSVSSDIVARETDVDSLTSELAVLREALAEREQAAASRVQDLEAEVARLTEVLVEAQSADVTAHTEVEALRAQLAAEGESIAALKADFTALQGSFCEEVAGLKEQLDEKAEQLAETLQLMEELAPSTSVSDEEHMLVQEELLACQTSLEEAVLQKEALEQQVTDLVAELTNRTTQLEATSSDLAAATCHVEELTTSKSCAAAEVVELRAVVAALQSAARSEAQQQAAEAGGLEEQLSEAQGDLSGADDLICELQLKITVLEKDAADALLATSVLQQSHAVALAELSEQLQNAHDVLMLAEEEKLRAEDEEAALHSELKALKAQAEEAVEASRSQLAALQEKLNSTEDELLGLSSELLQKDTDIDSLSAEVDQLRAAAAASSSATCPQDSVALAVELSNSQMSAQNTISALEVKVTELERELSAAVQSAVGKADDCEHRQKDHSTEVQKLSSLVGQKDGEISRLMAEVASLSERSATAETSLSMSRQQGTTADRDGEAQAKHGRQLQTRVDLLQSDKDSLLAKLSELEKQHKSSEHAAADAEYKLVAELEAAKAQLQKLTEASHSAFSQAQSLAAVEKTLAATAADLRAVTEQRERAIETIATLEEAKAALEAKVAEFEDSVRLQARLDELQSEKNDLQEQMQQSRAELADVELRCRRSKADHALMSEEVSRLAEVEASLSEEREGLLAAVASLQQAVAQAQEEFSSSSREGSAEVLAQHEEELAVLRESVEVLEADHAAVSQALSEAQGELEDRTAELQAAVRSRAEEVAVAAEAISALRLQLGEAAQESTRLQSHVAALQREVDSVAAAASEKRAQHMALVEELQATLAEKDEQISSLTARTAVSSGAEESEEYQQLLSEMNTLMEEKMEAEAKIQSAELETKRLRLELSDYDKKSAREVSLMMAAAQTEMDFLKSSFDEERVKGCEQIRGLREQVAELEQATAGAASDNALTAELEAELDEAVAASNSLQLQLHEASQALTTLEGEHKQLQRRLAAQEAEAAEVLEVKEQRIARLEKSKLTTDQMLKIKQVRENCTKKTEECRIYKKQLSQLKAAYEALQGSVAESETAKRSTRASSKDSSAELAAAKMSLTEVTAQLEQATFVSKTLKDKLRDCSKQLQEYEQDRHAIISILEDCDVDVTGLLLADESTAGDESVLGEQDLSEPVHQLAEKWRAAHSLVATLKGQVATAEDRFASLTSEMEAARPQKLALDKKLESAKSALRAAKQEQEELIAQVEAARQQTREVAAELATTKSSLSGSQDAVSTEVQVLEEENIELLRENKDLRIASATYRAKAEALARKLGASGLEEEEQEAAGGSAGKKRRAAHDLDMDTPVHVVPNRGREVDSAVEEVENAGVEGAGKKRAGDLQTPAPAPAPRVFGTALDENTLRGAGSALQQEAADSASKPGSALAGAGGRRGRRVKARAVGGGAATGEAAAAEQPGECNQS